MARRIRKQIYIDPEQEQALKRMAEETGLSEAEIIRQAIDRQTRVLWFPKRDREAWEREVEFIDQWMGQGVSQGQRTWRREDLYED
ncbi:MAG: ribbon-helix-helix domain-containing protein [Anaerolineae bacterium]|nr:ribbon-helix-helix domain-containing protein [Anaerolineae bacterium]